MDSKCRLCKRKTYLVIKCRCEHTFCITHRDPEDHSCTFDFKEMAKAQIAKANPVVVSDKMVKI